MAVFIPRQPERSIEQCAAKSAARPTAARLRIEARPGHLVEIAAAVDFDLERVDAALRGAVPLDRYGRRRTGR